MPAKNKRTPSGLDVYSSVAAHVDADAKAHEWAERSLALRAAGKMTQSKAAENKAKFWLSKVLALEEEAARGKPEGGRAQRE